MLYEFVFGKVYLIGAILAERELYVIGHNWVSVIAVETNENISHTIEDELGCITCATLSA